MDYQPLNEEQQSGEPKKTKKVKKYDVKYVEKNNYDVY